MSLTLTNIPAIMRHHSWHNGARLMDIWFGRTSAIAPAYGPPDTSTIKMDSWVLTFSRALTVYDQLMRDRVWANQAAQGEIATMLRRRGMLSGGGMSFGALNQPVENLDLDYINFRAVDMGLGDLDDLSAALGRFTFRVVIGGSVQPSGGGAGHRVTIQQVGVYVRDSYDFNGDQFLGYWDDSDNSVSMMNPFSGTMVRNSHFRDYRTRNGMGGDYIVFSDVKVTTLTTPDTFTIP